MYVLGINVGHDSGATLLTESGVVAAVNEERLSRKKLHTGFPELAIEEVLRVGGVRLPELNVIATEGRRISPQPDSVATIRESRWTRKAILALGADRVLLGTEAGLRLVDLVFAPVTALAHQRERSYFRARGFEGEFSYIDHHLCHAASAYYTQRHANGLAITLDASGEGYCSRVYRCEGGSMRLVHSMPCFHSPAYYYALVTAIIGHSPMRHEGKVTGLAAFGDPDEVEEVLRSFLRYDRRTLSFRNLDRYYVGALSHLRAALDRFSKEDVAAGIQAYSEKLVSQYIRDVVARFGGGEPCHLFLAGGFFANVKVNQVIQELPEVAGTYIFPNMGDGGLNMGAALVEGFQRRGFAQPIDIGDVYWGAGYPETEVVEALHSRGATFSQPPDLARAIAEKIVTGRVVGRFVGRTEYGPRALGNRSILYSAIDPSVNQWLNSRLRRTEYMPFAPYVRELDAAEYFELPAKDDKPYRFMTMTCRATERCKRDAPGVVHVDGTARPQIVTRDTSPGYYDILTEYQKLTGIGVLVNTSFNMHEEPIVNTPQQAIETFYSGKLDVLAIGNFLVENRD